MVAGVAGGTAGAGGVQAFNLSSGGTDLRRLASLEEDADLEDNSPLFWQPGTCVCVCVCACVCVCVCVCACVCVCVRACVLPSVPVWLLGFFYWCVYVLLACGGVAFSVEWHLRTMELWPRDHSLM